jgi:hypothetical protein
MAAESQLCKQLGITLAQANLCHTCLLLPCYNSADPDNVKVKRYLKIWHGGCTVHNSQRVPLLSTQAR